MTKSKAIGRAAKPANRTGKAEHGTSLMTAFREIRELIVHGRLSPGTWILEAEMASRLNMSRTPVRGAIHWLQREGYIVEQRPARKSRMIVAPLTKEDAYELYSIIGRIEGIAGRGVAALPAKQRKEIGSKLLAINKRLSDIASTHSEHPGEIFELDREFHRYIVKYGAGPRLTTLHNAVEPQAERYWRLYASSIIDNLHTSVKEHERIIRALEQGNADAMESSLQDNWINGAERLAQVIEIFGERGSW